MTYDEIAYELMDDFNDAGRCWGCLVDDAAVEFGVDEGQAAMAGEMFRDGIESSCDDHSPFTSIHAAISGTLFAMFSDCGWSVDHWRSHLAGDEIRDALLTRGVLGWFEEIGLLVRVV